MQQKVKKATKGEVEQRVSEIFEMIIDAVPYSQIVRYGKTKWDVSKNQIDDHVREANKRIKELAKEDQEEFRDKAKTRYNKLYNTALFNKDYREARRILESANKVLGYEKLNINLSGNIKLSEEELDKKIVEFYEEHNKGKVIGPNGKTDNPQ